MKISTYTQTLLQPENLDLYIIIDLNLDLLVDIASINPLEGTHDLIDDLL